MKSDKCGVFANSLRALQSEVEPSKGRDKLSVETCMASCDASNFKYGGVGGDNQCRACFTCPFLKYSSPLTKIALEVCDNDFQGDRVGWGDCQANTCVGDRREYCGSATALVLYSRTSLSG